MVSAAGNFIQNFTIYDQFVETIFNEEEDGYIEKSTTQSSATMILTPKITSTNPGGAYNSGILFFAGITVLASLCVSLVACKFYNDRQSSFNGDNDATDENGDDNIDDNNSTNCNWRRRHRNKKMRTMNNGNASTIVYEDGNVWTQTLRPTSLFNPPTTSSSSPNIVTDRIQIALPYYRENSPKPPRRFNTSKSYKLTMLQTKTKNFDDYEIEITSPETYV